MENETDEKTQRKRENSLSVLEILHPRFRGVYLLEGPTTRPDKRLQKPAEIKYYVGESDDLLGPIRESPRGHQRTLSE